MDNPDQSGNSKTGSDPTDKEEPKGSISADRLKAPADAVFAVAMTLLVLELVVPQIRDPSNQQLTHALLSMWLKFLAYVLSFLIAGIFWMVHYSIFDAIKYYDSTLAWIKVLILLLIALFPFTTSLLGEYFLQKTATIIYGVHLLFLFIGGFSLWSCSTSKHLLVVKGLDPGLVIGAKRMGYLYFVILSSAIIIGFFHPMIPVIIYGLFELIVLVFTGVAKANQIFTFSIPNTFNHEEKG